MENILYLKFASSVLASIITFFGFYPYIKDIFAGNTKPHLYTWLIWSLTQITNAIIVARGGAGYLASISFVTGSSLVSLVFILSIKYGTKNITKTDTSLLILELVAILFLWKFNDPLTSLLLISFIDLAGYIPTIRKSFEEPWSESLIFWILMNVGNIFTLIALNKYNILTTFYLIILFVGNSAVFSVCILRRRIIDKISK